MATANAINNATKTTIYASNDTWVKDQRSEMIDVWCISSGGAGGSGRQGSSTTSGGGGGGGAGTITYISGPSYLFPDSVSVTVGAESIGGLAQSTNNTNGNAGAGQNYSAFGDFYYNYSSGGGSGGSTGTVNAGNIPAYYFSNLVFTNPSDMVTPATSGGGTGKNTAGTTAPGGARMCMAAGGGGGGGADTVTARSGGDGAAITNYFKSVAIIAGGTGGIESGSINGSPGIDVTGYKTGMVTTGSGGGGGGGQSAGAAAGNGGKGGFPGGAGGGGGGSINGTNSGAGGNGAAGQVIVIEYLR